MTMQRAQLIQDLAKIELANIVLAKAATKDTYNHRADAWSRRVEAAQFDPAEEAEFQRVRAEFRALLK